MRPSILLFGDSITQQAFGYKDGGLRFGWASLLAATYTRRADILSRGFSGYNTNHALDILPTSIYPVIDGQNLLFCTIFFGANDSALAGMRQHVPIDKYKKNMKDIIKSIKERYMSKENIIVCDDDEVKNDASDKNLPLILITPPPVHEPKWNSFCVETNRNSNARTNESALAYGKCILSIGEELDIPVLDSFRALKGYDGEDEYSEYLSDGLHLTEEGNEIIHDELMKLIEEKLPNVFPFEGMDDKIDKSNKGIRMEEKDWMELC